MTKNYSSLEQHVLLQARLLPHYFNESEQEVWLSYLIQEYMPDIKSEQLQQVLSTVSNRLATSSKIIQEKDFDIYRPLAEFSELFDPIDVSSEDRLYAIFPAVMGDLISLVDSFKAILFSSDKLTECLKKEIPLLIKEKNLRLNNNEQNILSMLLINEFSGLGPLELLLNKPFISDILVNDFDKIYIEIAGKLYPTSVRFNSREHLLNIIKKIAAKNGRRVDVSNPYVDTRLADGSRVNAIIPPIAIDAPSLSIRRFNNNTLSLSHLVRLNALSANMASLLTIIANAKFNILVSGGTGSGKTTLLNALSWAINSNDRIITIEDSAELQLRKPHVVRLETRDKSLEGSGLVTQRHLIVNALRMRPDRIILGEARGAEAFDLLQAMNTGHEGSMSTIHANSPQDALVRLSNMVAMAEMGLSESSILDQIARTINIIIQVERLRDGSRKITSINQVYFNAEKQAVVEPLYAINIKQKGSFEKTQHSLRNTKKLIQSGLYDYYKELSREV